MAIFSDGVGNHYLGEAVFANNNVGFPSINYFQGYPKETITQELTALCTQAGLNFRDVYPQIPLLDGTTAGTSLYCLIAFGADTDTINDRYAFIFNQFNSDNTGISDIGSFLYNDSGFTGTGSGPVTVTTNRIAFVRNREITNQGARPTTGTDQPNRSNIYFAGVSDGKSLALFYTRYFFENNPVNQNLAYSSFYYAGLLDDVNTNFNYYSNNNMTRSILLSGYSGANFTDIATNMPPIFGAHFATPTGKLTLRTGDAVYPIACSDLQIPGPTWATDMYVFDNNATLGFPAIGRVRNLLLAEGTFTLGRPVRIQGSVFPDGGFNAWLPVGIYAGKTVLMRCYTTVAL